MSLLFRWVSADEGEEAEDECKKRKTMSPLGGAIVRTETRPCAVDADSQIVWYVLQTKRHRERVAQSFLARRDIASYLPQIVQWPRPVVGGETAPMFPGYLFVKTLLANEFTQIMWTPGVKAFVCFGGSPAPVDDSVIEFLRSREGPDGLIRCGDPLPQSSEVRIISGPFRGLTAVVEQRLPARERVRVLMYILARQTPVELPEKWVRRA